MPRMMLSMLTAIAVACMVCLAPTQTSANTLRGPERDPVNVNVDDNISLTCPMPITITCDANGIYSSFPEFQAAGGSVVLPDGCEESSIVLSWEGDTVMSQDGCEFVYMREYLLTADCDNTFTCNQLVMLNDTDDPFITNCPTDVNLSVTASDADCLAAFTVPNDVVATDGCSTATVTNDADPSGLFPVGSTTVTYTATDDCGNSSTCSFNIIVANNAALTVSCPPTIMISDPAICDASGVAPYADIDAFIAANGTIDGNCSVNGSAALTLTSNDVVTGASCPYTVTRTYTVTDDSGNTGTCAQMIQVSDDTDPTFTVPMDVTVDCSLTQDTSVTGAPSMIMDNCDAMPSVTWIDRDSVQLSTGCTGEISFTRTWTVTDNCTNATSMDQAITTVDTVAPIAICLVSDTLYLDADGDAAFVPDSLDNGSTDGCSEITYSTDPPMSFVSCNQIAGEIPITLIVSDGCGNSSTCDAMVILLDTMSITLTSPTNDTVMSIDDAPLPFENYNDYELADGSVNDNCLVNNILNLIGEDTLAVCQTTIVRTYEYIDASDNRDTATHTIVINDGGPMTDTEAPIITNVSNQFLMLEHTTCMFDTTFTLPVATDDTGVDTTFFTISPFVNDTAQVTFVAEDICGNIADTTFELIVFDPTSPDILIDDITIMCDTTGAAPIYTTVQEFLTGSGAMVYDCRLDSASFVHIGDDTLASGVINRTYAISDFTGNTGTEMQSITIVDMTDPEFTSCPASFSVTSTDPNTCTAMVDAPDPEFSDNCNGTLILTHNSPFGTSTTDVDGEYPVGATTVSYFLEDASGLMDTCTFTITVTDGVDPMITCPADTLVLCDFAAYSPATNTTELEQLGGSATDNCGIAAITSSIDTLSSTNYNVTYTAQDSSGNTSTCTHNVMVVDTIAPVFACGSASDFLVDITVNAPADACEILINIPIPNGTDNCDTNPTITNSLNNTDNASGLYTGSTAITWYIEDDFGNMDSCTYNITVTDATSPAVTNPPATTVMCSEMAEMVDSFFTVMDVVDAGGSIFDNCGVEFFNIISEIEIGEDTIIRTYEVIDSSDNTSVITQTIIIDDTTAPDFDAPSDVTIDCSIALDSLEAVGTVDSTMLMDNCGETDTLIYVDNVFSSGGCFSNDSIQRIWILTDDSGNERRDTQHIIRIDTVGPVFDATLLAIADIECGDALPPTQTLTATDACNGAFVIVDTLPALFPPNLCSDLEITYRYTAMDGCGNTTLDSVSFLSLADDTAPTLVDAMNQNLNTEPGICGVLVTNVPTPVFSDDCSGLLDVSSDFIGDTYPTGTTDVVWTAQNDCGLSTSITQVITITDNEPPVVVCQDLNVSLGGDGIAIVQADTLAKSISDNCDHFFGNDTKVRRVDSPSVCNNDGGFNDEVTFCCEDIGKTILVEVQVTDDAGNNNTCISEITINNAQGISLISGLPDISISCEFLFDPADLSIFGSFVEDPNDVEDIRIEDFYYQTDSIAGQDGVYINTCDATSVTETSEIRSGTCGRNTVIRSFLFDNGISTLTYVQTIYRSDVNLFNADGNDIIWPPYFEWDQCGVPAPDTSIAGSPILLNNDNCSQVAVSFKDQLFNFPLTSCPFIKRKWKVIDWCQFDATMEPNPGMWTYEQFINVTNNVPPTILSACTDTLVCAPGNACSATLDFSIQAEDDCMADAQNLYYQYVIDINNDNISSNDITGTSASFFHPVEAGVHQITWFVEDRCGNMSSCSFLATVRDCKDPTPLCLTGLAIDLSGNTSVELWASDVDYGSTDNCTAQSDLGISFSADVADDLVTFTCADLGNQLVELWVTDAAGNQAFCVAVVNVQDNSGACNPNVNNLAGRIATETNISIEEAMVSIEGAEMDTEYMTEEDGMYAFEAIDPANDYNVIVDRDKDHLQGVTTLDLVLIQRHILGLSQLDSPYKLIAADINSDERLTASDLLALRKVILGVEDHFVDNTSWRFVSKNSEMDDMDDPWPFTENLILNETAVDLDADFVGVKVGDVNNTADALLSSEIAATRTSQTLSLHTRDQKIKRDDQVLIDIYPSQLREIEALQMTIGYDTDVLHLVDVIPVGIDMRDYHMHTAKDGEITVAWTSIGAQKISSSTPLFQLVMEGEGTGRLATSLWIDSHTTAALAYDDQDRRMDIDLNYMAAEDTDIIFHQNRPNPFLESTIVEFDLPEDMEVTFKIFDGAGSLIYRQSADYGAGRNQITLGTQLGSYRGLLFLKMETAEFSDVRKMFRIE